ncbi:hypothetical protein RUND412_006354 [Rhizina undulata]
MSFPVPVASSLRKLFSRAESNQEFLNPNLYNVNNVQVQYFQAQLQWPWIRGGVHALGWVFFSVGMVAIFALINLRDILLDRRRLGYSLANNNKHKPAPDYERSLFDRISTHLRSFTYLRTVRWGLAPTSFGQGTLMLAGFLFPLLYCFTQHPYYLQYAYYGPPPLSGRSGMIAIAMTPFIIALGMKANLISLLTGFGHERLNAFHRWLAFFQFFFALLHAIPFIVEPLKNGGAAQLSAVFKHVTYWNGVDKWNYLWATVGIWASALVYRIIFKANWFGGGSSIYGELASFTALTDDGVKITIPTKMRWQAGQHVFIRIPGISLFDNHPFTVALIMKDEEPEAQKSDENGNDLVLVFKPHKGFTRRVYDISRDNPDMTYRAYLDGPYGGLSRKLEAFETVLMIAGGSGITPVCGHLQDLARKIKQGKALTRDIRIVWTVKHFECLEWFKDEIAAASRSIPRGMLLCQYYITKETPVPLPQYPVSATRDWPTSPVSGNFDFTQQRIRPLSRAGIYENEPSLFDNGRDLFRAQPSPPEPTQQWTQPLTQPPAQTVMQSMIQPGTQSIIGKQADTPAPEPAVLPQRRFSRRSKPRPPSIKVVDRGPSPLPPLGDEVLLEFGRPPLKDGLRPWSETFGKRACIYVCGPKSMKVDVANAVADMQTDIWASDEREEVYLHSETFGW